MKGLFMTFIIHFILSDTMLSLSDSCDGEHCSEIISMPIMDDMRATLNANLDVSKMNKHLKAYIQQEIDIGVKTAMENQMKQMIENKTKTMDAEITGKFNELEESIISKTDQMERLIKNESEMMITEIMTMSKNTNTDITIKSKEMEKRQTAKTDQMEQLIKNKTEDILTFFKDNEEELAIQTDQMAQIITDKSAEMLTLFKDNNNKMETSFDVKVKEFEQKFEVKDRFKYVFFSYLSSGKRNFIQDKILVFDVVPLNIGNAYNGTTGKFTCKEDGIYTFSWTTNEGISSVFLVDGKPIASNYNSVVVNEWYDDQFIKGSISVIVKMTKGQKAWLKVEDIGDYSTESSSENTPSSVFSGFKI